MVRPAAGQRDAQRRQQQGAATGCRTGWHRASLASDRTPGCDYPPIMPVDTARLEQLLEPVVASVGCDLEDVGVSPAGKRSVVRVVVDKDGGVDLDCVADVSRAVSAALDGSELLGESPYVLEVTSPGVDRLL